MRTSAIGQAFIAHWEWIPRSTRCGWDPLRQLYFPYKDYRGFPTFGIGHLIRSGEDFSSGLTEFAVMQIFAGDLVPVEEAIKKYVTMPLTQHQFDALVDFGFNEGTERLNPNDTPSNPGGNSAIKLLNMGRYELVPEHLEAYCNSAGQHDPGLLNRRKAEGTVWGMPDAPEDFSDEARIAYARRFGIFDLVPYAPALPGDETPTIIIEKTS